MMHLIFDDLIVASNIKKRFVKSKNAYKVLIIDDEPDLCDRLKTICTQKGLNAVIANNLQEALLSLQQNPNLIFLNLPGGFGTEFMRIIRAHAENSLLS